MRMSFPPLSHCFPVLPVAVLLFSTHFLLAQTTPSESRPSELPDAPTPVSPPAQAASPIHFPQPNDRRLFSIDELAKPHTGMAKVPGRDKYLVGKAPQRSITFASAYPSHSTANGADAWMHLSQRIPWAHSVIQRGSQLSKAHPHVTGMLKAIKPKL